MYFFLTLGARGIPGKAANALFLLELRILGEKTQPPTRLDSLKPTRELPGNQGHHCGHAHTFRFTHTHTHTQLEGLGIHVLSSSAGQWELIQSQPQAKTLGLQLSDPLWQLGIIAPGFSGCRGLGRWREGRGGSTHDA